MIIAAPFALFLTLANIVGTSLVPFAVKVAHKKIVTYKKNNDRLKEQECTLKK